MTGSLVLGLQKLEKTNNQHLASRPSSAQFDCGTAPDHSTTPEV